MNFDKLNEMSNVVKYENFNKWKDGQSYKVKKMTSDIVIKYITNVAIKYVLNYAFERYTEDEKNNIIVQIIDNIENVDVITAYNTYNYDRVDNVASKKLIKVISLLDNIHYFKKDKNLFFFLDLVMSKNIFSCHSRCLMQLITDMQIDTVFNMVEKYKDNFFSCVSINSFCRNYFMNDNYTPEYSNLTSLTKDYLIKFVNTLNREFQMEYEYDTHHIFFNITLEGLDKLVDNKDVKQQTIRTFLKNIHIKKIICEQDDSIVKPLLKKIINKLLDDKENLVSHLCFNKNDSYSNTYENNIDELSKKFMGI